MTILLRHGMITDFSLNRCGVEFAGSSRGNDSVLY
jgi:hypothetical protein